MAPPFVAAELRENVTPVRVGLLVPFRPKLYMAPPLDAEELREKITPVRVGLLVPPSQPLLKLG
jgi:hypothetical protein